MPNERPPFMTSSPSGAATPEGDSIRSHPSPRTVPSNPKPIRVVIKSNSEDSLRRKRDAAPSITTSNGASGSDVTVIAPQRDIHSSHSRDRSPLARSQDEQEISRKDSHPSPSQNVVDLESRAHAGNGVKIMKTPKRIGMDRAKRDHSPPLTGKDSAYSSVSGGSFASPTAALPRSASAQGAYPRAQFGLFPSSNPGTPKTSMSGRYGAMSPAIPSPRHVEQVAYHPPPPRAQTSLDNHNASRRLLKKSSLSSLKRLFSKKKHGGVDTIAE